MRPVPGKRRGLRRALAALLVVGALASGAVTIAANRTRPGPLVRAGGPLDAPRALVVYHPGLSGFTSSVAGALAEGLVDAGWRTDVAPVSRAAPSDLSLYGLVVAVSPTYWWTVARPVRTWIGRATGLGRTVAVVTGAGQGGRALRVLGRLLEAHGGTVVERRAWYTWAPNDEANYQASENRAVAFRQARELGASLRLPEQ